MTKKFGLRNGPNPSGGLGVPPDGKIFALTTCALQQQTSILPRTGTTLLQFAAPLWCARNSTTSGPPAPSMWLLLDVSNAGVHFARHNCLWTQAACLSLKGGKNYILHAAVTCAPLHRGNEGSALKQCNSCYLCSDLMGTTCAAGAMSLMRICWVAWAQTTWRCTDTRTLHAPCATTHSSCASTARCTLRASWKAPRASALPPRTGQLPACDQSVSVHTHRPSTDWHVLHSVLQHFLLSQAVQGVRGVSLSRPSS